MVSFHLDQDAYFDFLLSNRVLSIIFEFSHFPRSYIRFTVLTCFTLNKFTREPQDSWPSSWCRHRMNSRVPGYLNARWGMVSCASRHVPMDLFSVTCSRVNMLFMRGRNVMNHISLPALFIILSIICLFLTGVVTDSFRLTSASASRR